MRSTNNIKIIKQELKNCFEVKMPYNFKKGDSIKYITLVDNSEMFYFGGNFVKFGNDLIFLEYKNVQWAFKLKIKDDNNNVIYKSKIFLEKKEDKNKDKSIDELKEIIESQQKVIDKMSVYLKKYQNENEKYKQAMQKLKSM